MQCIGHVISRAVTYAAPGDVDLAILGEVPTRLGMLPQQGSQVDELSLSSKKSSRATRPKSLRFSSLSLNMKFTIRRDVVELAPQPIAYLLRRNADRFKESCFLSEVVIRQDGDCPRHRPVLQRLHYA